MEYTTCKDSVMELISDGSKVFGRDYKISEEMLSKIDEICDGVDELVSEIECESVHADIEEKTKTLRIVIVCDELELHGGRTNGFFKLITKLNSFSFSKQGPLWKQSATVSKTVWITILKTCKEQRSLSVWKMRLIVSVMRSKRLMMRKDISSLR